jgi:biopolymer transport protein ExbD
LLPLTPLIDVVFLLLIFPLVAARFAQEDRELDVVLPRAGEAKPLIVQPRELLVDIDKDGRFFVGGRVLRAAEVEAAMRRAVADNPANQSVVIRADKRVQFEYVVDVMSLCNKAGVHGYKVTAAGDAAAGG